MFTIELIPTERLDSILPLLQLLNPSVSEDVITQRLNNIRKTDYQCVGVFDDSQLIAISGLWMLNKIYAGKHIEPDNVVVHPDYRSKGVGELLLNWIHQYGKKWAMKLSGIISSSPLLQLQLIPVSKIKSPLLYKERVRVRLLFHQLHSLHSPKPSRYPGI